MAERNQPAAQVTAKHEKAFDRGVCFTFFADYWDTAQKIEASLGVEKAYSYIEAVAEYSLYGVEPELDLMLDFVWPTTKATIDKNIERRKRGFGREDTEQTERIIREYEKDPQASQEEIGKRAGASVGKVNKVIKRLKSDSGNGGKRAESDHAADSDTSTISITDSHSYSSSNSCNERERERSSSCEPTGKEEKRTVYDLETEELRDLLNEYRARVPYKVLREKYRIADHGLSKDAIDLIPGLILEREAIEERRRMAESKDSVVSDKALLGTLSELSGYSEAEWIDHLDEMGLDAAQLWAAVNDDEFIKEVFNKEYFEENLAKDFESYWELMPESFALTFKKNSDGTWVHSTRF